MASKPVTEEKCYERTTKINEALNGVQNSVNEINVMMNGKLGVVNTLLKVADKVEAIEDAVTDIKKNGTLKGKDKALVYAAAIAAISSLGVAYITYQFIIP